jgi:UDP-N-acetylglucosamine diphosphorylase/glucosamine-1-phosphate N-acetyltransferase
MSKKELALILAAGKGTRMKSDLPKPLVPFMGKPIVEHLIDSFHEAGIEDVALVVGHGAEHIKAAFGADVQYVEQKEQLGTAHAVMMAEKPLDWKGKDIFVFVGDSPLVSSENIKALLKHHRKTDAACTFLTADFPEPYPYARLIRDDKGELLACIEERDCTEEQKKISQYLTSHYVFKAGHLFNYLHYIEPNLEKREYYLTDIIEILKEAGHKVETLAINEWQELVGLNTPEELQWAEDYKTGKG